MIRIATQTDLPCITEIYRDAVLHGTASYELEPPSLAEMTSRFRSLRAKGYPFLVATDSNETVLGYAYAGPFRARPAYRFMVENSIYITPEAKGRGLGAALLEALIDEVQKLGFRQIIAVIGDGTPESPSVRLHEKLGFHQVGRLKGSGYKHGRWLDTTFMQLEINGGTQAPPSPGSWPEIALKDG